MSDGNGNGGGARAGWVLFVWSPTGYSLSERDGEAPSVGSELDDNGRTLVVTKLGASPLPGDGRTCAFTVGKS